ncbi:MAG: PAS domain S-box protein [Chloroflexi bacterium]|nr:PAS domain S-box protein [Chloroflexota bacterium]
MVKSSIKVLLIEDNPTDALLLKEFLNIDPLADFDVTVGKDLKQGLSELGIGKFDVLLLDLGLPDSQGLETFTRVHAEYPDIPVIILSGAADELLALQAMQAGAQDYLIKGQAGWQLGPRAIRYAIERHQSQLAMRANEEKFRLAFEASPDSIAITRLSDGMFISVNKGFEEITGYNRNQVIGKTAPEINIWKNPEDRQRFVEELQAKGEIRNYEAPFLTPGGERHGLMSAAIVELNGAPHILNITRDITERKRMEEALKVEREFMKALMNTVPVQIYFKDTESRFLRINNAQARLFGLGDPGQAVGKTDFDFFTTEHAQQAFDDEQEIIRTGQPISKEERETWNNRPDRWVSTTKLPLCDEDEKIIGTFGISMNITERKQAEEALRESEQRFRLASWATKDIIWERNFSANTISWNNRLLRLLHYLAEEVEPTVDWWQDHIHPDERAKVMDSIQTAIDQRENFWSKEYRFQIVDGSYVNIFDRGYILYDGQGDPARMIGAMADFTYRKQAEEALRGSEKKYRELINGMSDTVWVIDFDASILDVNNAAVAVLGYTREELLSMKIQDIDDTLPSEQIQNLIDIMPRNKTQVFETWHTTKDGRKLPVEISSSLVSYKGKTAIMSIARNIAERKKAETERQNFYNVLNASLNELYIFDAQTLKFEFVSAGALRNLGYTMDELREMTPLNLKPTFTLAAFENLIGPLRCHKVPVIHFETFHRRADGSDYPVEVHLQLSDQPGRQVFLAVILDITEIKQARETLQEYNTRLEAEVQQRTLELREAQEQLVRQERLATLGQLAGGVGHELRNPLGVISNAVYYLKLIQPDASDKVHEYLNIIEKEIHASDKIVTDLLDFTRIKSLDRRPVSVSELVAQTLERYPVPPSIEKLVKLPTDLPKIYADPQHVIQTLVNLVSNACQAIVNERSTTGMLNAGKLTITAAAENDMIRIDVQDTGTGISPENMKRLFEPLFTTKTKGIGLGLAVSRKLIEANGGRIEVESKPGQGSIFTVLLPTYRQVVK